MLNIISSVKLIIIFSVIYFLLVSGLIKVLSLFEVDWLSDLRVAFLFATIFEIFLLYLFSSGWRKVWQWCPKLNDWFFPDLNGKWNAEIAWNWNKKKDTKKGTVIIRQTLTKFSLNLSTNESVSSTLMAKPFKDSESDQAAFYYIYRAESIDDNRNKRNEEHLGAAILKIDLEDNNIMTGNYFTNRESYGTYTFTRL